MTKLEKSSSDLMEIPHPHSRFNRRVQIHHRDMWSFIKFVQEEENSFNDIRILFNGGLGARSNQSRRIAIQRGIDNLDRRYYDCLLTPMESLDGLAFLVAKRKN